MQIAIRLTRKVKKSFAAVSGTLPPAAQIGLKLKNKHLYGVHWEPTGRDHEWIS